MQKLSKEDLIKSLSFNMFYPRDLNKLEYSVSYDINDESEIFICSDLDELGYARRYTKKLLFYKLDKISEEELISASIYGADGIVCNQAFDKNLMNLARNSGFNLGYLANNKADLFKAILHNFNIFIGSKELLSNLPKNKHKGVINDAS